MPRHTDESLPTMMNAAEVALFLGLLTALLSRLPRPYVSSVWCAIGTGSFGLWLIGLSQATSLAGGLAFGLLLQFVFSFAFISAASVFEHAADVVSTRRQGG